MVGGSETGKLSEAADFQEEVDALHALLATLPDDDWERPTRFKSWTVNDIVQHLHEGDLMAAASVAGADPFDHEVDGLLRRPRAGRPPHGVADTKHPRVREPAV